MKKWYFTFGCGQKHSDKIVCIEEKTHEAAREKMFAKFGPHFCTSYHEDELHSLLSYYPPTVEILDISEIPAHEKVFIRDTENEILLYVTNREKEQEDFDARLKKLLSANPHFVLATNLTDEQKEACTTEWGI
jgi:hypothetical protein